MITLWDTFAWIGIGTVLSVAAALIYSIAIGVSDGITGRDRFP